MTTTRWVFPPAGRAPRTWAIATAVALAAALAAPGSRGSEIAEQTRVFVENLHVADADVTVIVGEPDPRLNLAPCRHYEPFVPPGARLWGRTSLGVRCVDGAAWTVYLPTQIKVYADAPVAARGIARGQTLAADDIRQDRVELTLYPAGALAGTEPLAGRVATRTIGAGEPLRRDLLRARQVLQAGDLVQVVAGGRGFAVATDGKALTAGTDGQTVQVAVGSGRVVTGVARPGQVVEVR